MGPKGMNIEETVESQSPFISTTRIAKNFQSIAMRNSNFQDQNPIIN